MHRNSSAKIRMGDAFRIMFLTAVAAVAFSCGTTRALEEGQYRLAENSVEITDDSRFSTKEISGYIKQKANSYIAFGWNPFLNVYNLAGKGDSWFANALRRIGVAPVIYDESLVQSSVDDITRHLEFLGYYNAKVSGTTEFNGRLAKVKYSVTLGNRFRIGNIDFSVPEGDFAETFYADTANMTIKRGDYLSEDALEKETERSAAYFRRNGFFGFTKNYYSFEADTLFSSDTAGLRMTVNEYTRNQSPESARPLTKYTIGDVNISYDKDLRFHDKVLRALNHVKPGSVYDELDVNNTYSRFSSLKVFSGVNVELTPRDSSVVDCNINLSKSRLQGFKLNLEGSTNSTGLIGISPQLSYFHKNVFRGGQWLNLSFLGNFQFKTGNSDVHSNEFGVSTSINFPTMLGLPNSMFKGPSVPHTEISASYNYQNRPEYTRNMISTSFGYFGSIRNGRVYYQLYPLQTKIVRLYHVEEDFWSTISNNPYLRDAYQNHFDVGSGASLYISNNSSLNPKSDFKYLRIQFDISGNFLSLFNGCMKTDEYGSRLIWGVPYSQYVRTEITLGKTVFLGRNENSSIAGRFLAGVGCAYGNSSSIPFEKQFYSGGASSMRGWQARSLGPGKSPMNSLFTIPSQTGDVKLEANVEFRFPMFWKFNGALFLDAGNIWTIKDSETGEDSVFRFDDFYEAIAANWGLGVRIDLNFLVLRLDVGIKLHDPSAAARSWYGPSQWLESDTYAVHFGVGMPF